MAKKRGGLIIPLFYVLGFTLVLGGGLLLDSCGAIGAGAFIFGTCLIGAAMIIGVVIGDSEPPRVAGGIL